MIAAAIAQLFPLQAQGPKSPRAVTFERLAKPLSVTFVAASIIVSLLGGLHFWRQQNAMIRGKIFSAPGETMTTGLLCIVVSLQ